MRGSHDIAAIKERLSLIDVVERLLPGTRLKRAGREYVILSPFKAERTPSCYLHPGKGTWYCFATSQGGDVITFVEKMLGLDFRSALDWCRQAAGLTDADPSTVERIAAQRRDAQSDRDKAEAEERAAARERAWQIWRESEPAAGTPVETYLRARGIDCDALKAMYGWTVPPSLRFHPRLPYRLDGVRHDGPAMVGLAMTPDRQPVGVHRTWLSPCGTAKAALPSPKLTLGDIWGAAGWLAPVAPEAIVGEGYETTLTVLGALAAVGRRAFAVSAFSLGNMAGAGLGPGRPRPGKTPLPSLRPDPERPGLVLPEGVTSVTLLEDADGRDPEMTRALVDRALAKFRNADLSARVASPWAGSDFNDMARSRWCVSSFRKEAA